MKKYARSGWRCDVRVFNESASTTAYANANDSSPAGFEQSDTAWIVNTKSDKGPGIPEVDLERIFDRFYRLPGSQGSGSGLGLAIVKQIVGQQGASIELVNANPGLVVTVRFQPGVV